MILGRWTARGGLLVILVSMAGCASLEDFRQAQMDNRNLIAEKAQLEQEVFDLRSANQGLRGRVDGMEDQIQSKDLLIANLQNENDNLERGVRQAQSLVERFADRPLDKPVMVATILPAELDAALREFAAQHPESVSYDSAHGTVKWTSDLLFALGSDVVKDAAKSSLSQFSEIVKSAAAHGFDVLVAGHTDNVRIAREATRLKHPSNWHLSVHRAISVASELQSHSVAPTRIGVMGFGEYRPLSANDSETNRSRNRRVEMYMVPSGAFSGGVAQTAMSFTGEQPAGTVK